MSFQSFLYIILLIFLCLHKIYLLIYCNHELDFFFFFFLSLLEFFFFFFFLLSSLLLDAFSVFCLEQQQQQTIHEIIDMQQMAGTHQQQNITNNPNPAFIGILQLLYLQDCSKNLVVHAGSTQTFNKGDDIPVDQYVQVLNMYILSGLVQSMH